ncbi:MAG: glycosyltransferase family 4 protein [Candidatus Aegiribacteria sp.]|nr:glycosyltransferase family 4 protein [Candidatus Aegiribacteria sp.]
MRVGFDATNILGHSGIRTYTRELVRALAFEFPDDKFLLYTTFSSSKKGILQKIFGEYSNIDIIGGLPHIRMLGDSLKRLTVLTGSLAWRFHERKIDIVHLTDPYGTPALPGSFVATINDIFPITQEQYRNSDLQRQYLSRTPVLLKRADAIITPSSYVAETLHRKYPSCTLDIVPVHDAASVSFKPVAPDKQLLKRYGLSGNSYFLFIGRVDPRKNISNLLEAYSLIPEDIRRKNHLVLVLSGGEEDKKNFQARNEAFLKDRSVHTIEGISEDDLVQLYSSATAFVFPSFAEGFGLPIIEAMQCGCPVITSNASCLPEIAGDAAILVDPLSPTEIASAMKTLTDPAGIREQLIPLGFEQAKHFSWNLTAKRSMEVYRSVLRHNGKIFN